MNPLIESLNRGLVLIMVVALVTLPMACKKNESSRTRFTLSSRQAQELETQLRNDPEDVTARQKLLTYYTTEQYKSPSARKARQGHVLWLIEHRPDTLIKPPFLTLNPHLDGAVYGQGKALWLKQVQDNAQNLAILENAADFLLLFDRTTAQNLLQQAQTIEPNNSHWSEKLAHLYALDANSGDTNSAVMALAELEKGQDNTAETKFDNLGQMAKMALAAGEMEKAKNYANDLLRQAPEHRQAWNYGNAIHEGNLILGRVALREGRIAEAKNHLLEAGKTPGSPQLNSFGPNMSLAKDLLAKGEKDTVVAYFKLCGAFWKMGADKLESWTKAARDGRVPDFGANLVY
jgi:hypothetical protein